MLTTLTLTFRLCYNHTIVWLTLPFYDCCGFRSVAVNSVYKLQFFTFILPLVLIQSLSLGMYVPYIKGTYH